MNLSSAKCHADTRAHCIASKCTHPDAVKPVADNEPDTDADEPTIEDIKRNGMLWCQTGARDVSCRHT